MVTKDFSVTREPQPLLEQQCPGNGVRVLQTAAKEGSGDGGPPSHSACSWRLSRTLAQLFFAYSPTKIWASQWPGSCRQGAWLCPRPPPRTVPTAAKKLPEPPCQGVPQLGYERQAKYCPRFSHGHKYPAPQECVTHTSGSAPGSHEAQRRPRTKGAGPPQWFLLKKQTERPRRRLYLTPKHRDCLGSKILFPLTM